MNEKNRSEAEQAEKTARRLSTLKQYEFKKGTSGNPKGRPKSVQAASTRLRAILNDNADNIVKAVVAQAILGDSIAQRLCFERLIPKVRDCMSFRLPDLTSKDSEQLVRELYAAMSYQEVTAEELKQILELVRTHKAQKEEDTEKQALLTDLKQFESEMRAKYEKEL